jgi:hypothetical protein
VEWPIGYPKDGTPLAPITVVDALGPLLGGRASAR